MYGLCSILTHPSMFNLTLSLFSLYFEMCSYFITVTFFNTDAFKLLLGRRYAHVFCISHALRESKIVTDFLSPIFC